ncbi:MAG: antibiotic biosynthesis monooxygenase family protein [Stellaceae bacterium]
MFVVIFTVQPRSGHFDEYLGLARSLRPELEKIDGFIDNERFASQRQEGRILSLSIWRDEKAVIRWRTLGAHHHVQERGRSAVFADYHLRVGEIVTDTGLPPGPALAEQRLDETETGAAKAATISEVSPATGAAPAGADLAAALGLPAVGTRGLVDGEVFESITNPGKLLLLAAWQDAAAGRWQPGSPAAGALRHRRVRIIRDYGMSDRREAPQYYPPVSRNG